MRDIETYWTGSTERQSEKSTLVGVISTYCYTYQLTFLQSENCEKDEKNIRIAINTDASLAEEIQEIVTKHHTMQAIVSQQETIWASNSSAKIVVKVDSGKIDVDVTSETNDQLRDLSQSDLDSLSVEFGKLDCSTVVKGLAKTYTVSSHGKQKKGLNSTIFIKYIHTFVYIRQQRRVLALKVS